MVARTFANSAAERRGVGNVKCLPARGSTAQNTLAVPLRLYSLSRFGDDTRTNRLWWTDFAMERNRFLIKTHHRFLRIMGLLVQFQHVFHARQISGVDL